MRALAAVISLLMLVACGSDAEPDASAGPSPTASPTTTFGKRCGLPDADAEQLSLRSKKGAVLSGAAIGEGGDVAVLLHQTDGDGLCGFWAYANRLADQDLRAVLVDLCGYGQADCDADDDFAAHPASQVRLAVDWARDHGAERVTLVGASMGGSIALGTAEKLGVDAVVDLSGPVDWKTVPSALKAAPAITIPALVIASPIDPSTDAGVLKQAVALMPATHKRFVEGADGRHGWDLLQDYSDGKPRWTEASELVARWIAGSYD